jgi:hypothetical protein
MYGKNLFPSQMMDGIIIGMKRYIKITTPKGGYFMREITNGS